MLLVIEMEDYSSPGYGAIHKAGCKHVKDPMAMTKEPTNLANLTRIFHETTGWEDYDQHEVYSLLAPCAKNFRQG